MSQVLSHQQVPNAQAVPSAETIAAASPVNLSVGPFATKIRVSGQVNLLTGATVTAVVLKIYRGAVIAAGQLLKTYTLTIGAAANGSIPFSVEDTVALLSQAGGGGYSFSLTQTGGTTNGSVNDADLQVDALP